jgi:SAM-dependent methyltransferase
MNSSNQNQDENANTEVSANPAGDYFDYLLQRSTLAWIYRKYWVYPRLCRSLTGKVLDVGCGIGDLLAFRENTIGVDINPRAVAWCRENGYKAELMRPDNLPFPTAEFDGVVIDNVLEHIADPKPLLAEVQRVLKPTGHVLIGVPGKRGYVSDPDHKVYYDAASLVATLDADRFVLKQMFFTPFKSAWLDTYMRQYCVYGVYQRV